MREDKSLAEQLRSQLQLRGLTVDGLAERTKVPKSTIRWLLDEEVEAVLPGRVYLRAQAACLGRELGMDESRLKKDFDMRFPKVVSDPEDETAGVRRGAALMGASLGCVAVVAAVFAAITAF